MIDGTPLLRLYARARLGRLDRLDPAEAQRRTLRRLAAAAAHTRFGRDHGFAAIEGASDPVAAFQALVPLRRYDQFWTEYWQPAFPVLRDVTWPGTVPFFALSSGTSAGRNKYIPCTRAMVRANARAGLDLLCHHVAARPASRVLAGRSFMLGGSTDLTAEAPGVQSGDLSGIAARCLPWYGRPFRFPPVDLALLADWEEKLERLAALAPGRNIRSLTGTPSWLLILFDRLAALHPPRGGQAAGVFPDLELVVHGGVDFAPYRRRFEQWLDGSHAELREAYAASEGFVALADRGPGEGLRLAVDNGLFFEFVPVAELDRPNPVRHWAGTLETGVDYAVVLSSCAGLWAYVLGDTVRFIDRAPPRLLITGRISSYLSAFGEHLLGEQIERAVADAADAIGAMVTDHTVAAQFPERPGELGGHLFVVEFAGAPPEAEPQQAFAATLDARLSALNEDYALHRAGGFGLRAPTLLAVPPGTFVRWMKSRGKLGGQHKVPRILRDADEVQALRRHAAAMGRIPPNGLESGASAGSDRPLGAAAGSST